MRGHLAAKPCALNTVRAVAVAGAVLISGIATAANAGTLTQVTSWGTLDPGCTFEHASCASDPAFTPSFGGYRAGGQVSWGNPLNPLAPFMFDTSAFTSISSIQLSVLVVGFWQEYTGNIDPTQLNLGPGGGVPNNGQIGDYLAIDGVPFAPFLGMTDGRDTATFDLTTALAPGPHTFTVVAYDDPPGPWDEGWAGVDVATLTVTGETAGSVPEPAAVALFACGLATLGSMRRRRAAIGQSRHDR